MQNFNEFPTPAKVEEPIGINESGAEANRDCTNSFEYIIGNILYL